MEVCSNNIILSGRVAKIYPLKRTLSGVPVVSFIIEHTSTQLEASMPVEIRCRVYCIALDHKELLNMDFMDSLIEVQGFLSYNSRSQLVLHIRQTKFLNEGS